MKEITIPVLLLQSTYVDSEHGRRPLSPGMSTPFMSLVTNLIRDAEAKVIAGCGHFPMIEAAQAVNEEIRTFASRIAGTA